MSHVARTSMLVSRNSRALQSSKKRHHGRFSKSCACINHENFVDSLLSIDEKFSVFNLETSKKFKKKTLDTLVSKGLISVRAKYLCDACVKYAELHLCGKIHSESTGTLKTVQGHDGVGVSVFYRPTI